MWLGQYLTTRSPGNHHQSPNIFIMPEDSLSCFHFFPDVGDDIAPPDPLSFPPGQWGTLCDHGVPGTALDVLRCCPKNQERAG